jgi:hypothetical protein
VGEVNPNSLQKYVDNLEIKENKTIRYSVMKMSDFKYRKDVRDRFITSVLNSKKQVLIDEHNLLNEN